LTKENGYGLCIFVFDDGCFNSLFDLS